MMASIMSKVIRMSASDTKSFVRTSVFFSNYPNFVTQLNGKVIKLDASRVNNDNKEREQGGID